MSIQETAKNLRVEFDKTSNEALINRVDQLEKQVSFLMMLVEQLSEESKVLEQAIFRNGGNK